MRVYKIGKGLLNSLIDKLPFEAHIPTYNYCGPGTKLDKRLERGDRGINQLDEACKVHDIAYSIHKDDKERTKADQKLSSEAWKRVISKDASIGERTTALAVTAAMKTKIGLSKMGRGLSKTRRIKKKKKVSTKKSCTFNKLVQHAKKAMKLSKPATAQNVLAKALVAARYVKESSKPIPHPRIIPIPKKGGMLPLVPILAGLSALGSLAGGSAAVVRTIGEVSAAKKELEESKRHNKTLEAIAIGKSPKGEGLYLKPYKKGYGLYLKPYTYSKNS